MGRAGVFFFFIRETPVIALAFGHALRGVDALFLALLVPIICIFCCRFPTFGFLPGNQHRSKPVPNNRER